MYGNEPTVIYNLVQPPGIHPVHTIPNNYTMAGKRSVDIKLAFEFYDMMPGAAGKKFQRNVLLNGGSADTQGFSITDCFLRIDDYAVQNGQPITMPPPAGVLWIMQAVPSYTDTWAGLIRSCEVHAVNPYR